MSRDQGSGKFRPMSEVSHGPKFPAARGNRRDFPETKEEMEEEEEEEDKVEIKDTETAKKGRN